LHHRNACGAWGRRGLNPHGPLPFPLVISQRGYAPVGRLGVEPSDTCASGRPRRPAGSRPADGRGPDPQRSRAPPVSSRGLPPGRFPIHCEEGGGLEPQRARPGAFETPPAALAGSPSTTAPRPGVNRPGMEEDGRLERQRFHARPLSRRGPPPGGVIFRGERVTRTPRS